MPRFPDTMEYSEKYEDDIYEYKHVILPKEKYKQIKDKKGCLTQDEWINLGVQQSLGWVNYARYAGEPHILLFRRVKGTDLLNGEVSRDLKKKIEKYEREKIEHLNVINTEINYDDYK